MEITQENIPDEIKSWKQAAFLFMTGFLILAGVSIFTLSMLNHQIGESNKTIFELNNTLQSINNGTYIHMDSYMQGFEKGNNCSDTDYYGGDYGFYYDIDNPQLVYFKKHNETDFKEVLE